ncbi:Transposon Ty3-G Gag-Pol polyprotein [Dictyocoela muelleri]|nr:Transposon Ty3-G Gag-Pol polyprotein [Dictyocoela muelleri]
MEWNDLQVIAKAKEAFYTGLSKRTKLEMSRLNIKTIVGIYEIINCKEETLMEQMSINEPIRKQRQKHTDNNNYKQSEKKCSFHGVCNHTTSECRAIKIKQNQKKENELSNDRSKNLVVQPKVGVPEILEVKAFINNFKYTAIMDTGSSYNYISDSIVKEHSLHAYTINQVKAELVNGESISTNKETKLKFQLQGGEDFDYEACVKILPSMDPSFILGMEFITKYKANIDLNQMKVTLGNTEHKLELYSVEKIMDDKVDEMSKIYNHNHTKLSDNLNALLNINATEISNIGMISKIEHRIELTENRQINMKPFRIPLRIKEKTNSLINSLLKDNIIRPSTSTFSSAAFPILKKNGDIRLVVDYRQLNKITQAGHYIFPQIWNLLVQ